MNTTDSWLPSPEKLLNVLNSMPRTNNVDGCIQQFKKVLMDLLEDLDHVSILVNSLAGFDHDGQKWLKFFAAEITLSDDLDYYLTITNPIEFTTIMPGNAPRYKEREAPRFGDLQPCSVIVYEHLKHKYPIVLTHHEPLAFEYRTEDEQFIGVVFLWRNLDKPPVSEPAVELMTRLRNFIVFILEDMIARAALARPLIRGFFQAMATFIETVNLLENEAQVVGHLLLGRSYEQTADRMKLSVNTVRKYVKSVYDKGGVHSFNELYAKYFLPWPGYELLRNKREPYVKPSNNPGHKDLTTANLLHFLNSLPRTTDHHEWIQQFKKIMLDLLPGIDHISLHPNMLCDLSGEEQKWLKIFAEGNQNHTGSDSYLTAFAPTDHANIMPGDYSHRDLDEADDPQIGHMRPPSTIIYGHVKRNDPRIREYHEPLAFEYTMENGAFLGSLFLWRKLDKSPVSEPAVALVKRLRNFITFALGDVIARAELERPLFRGLFKSMARLVNSAGLLDHEARVVAHLLMGLTYDQVADRMKCSVNTVRKYITSVYRKADVHSINELYAKYFLPWQG